MRDNKKAAGALATRRGFEKTLQQAKFTPNSQSKGDILDRLLSRLEKVRKTGNGTYLACCPAHADKSPSLTIRELDDGRILLHDFGGCGVESVLQSIGLDLSDLFPPREIEHARPERRAFPVADVLRAIGFEVLVVAAAATALLNGKPFSQADRGRLFLAVGRIQSALNAAGVSHG